MRAMRDRDARPQCHAAKIIDERLLADRSFISSLKMPREINCRRWIDMLLPIWKVLLGLILLLLFVLIADKEVLLELILLAILLTVFVVSVLVLFLGYSSSAVEERI